MAEDRPHIDRSAAAIGLLLVLVANARYLTGLAEVLDPMMAMDPYYIDMAQRPAGEILRTDPSWGPLYALWLKPFVALLGDPLRVYFATADVLSVGVSVAIYTYLLLLTRRAAPAAAASLLFLISPWNVPLDSRVSGFALLVVVAGLAAAETVPRGARRMSIAALAVLFASHARPELYPGALAFCAAALWLANREARHGDPRSWSWPIAVSIAIVAAAAWTGTPAFGRSDGIDRFLAAFREHFAWNWNLWHQTNAPMPQIWEREFGGADTVLHAALTNPQAFARHIGDNVVGALALIVKSSFEHFPLFAPATHPRATSAENVLVAMAGFAMIAAALARRDHRRALGEHYGYALFQYAALTAACTVSAALVFPVPRYLTVPCVLAMLTAALAASVVVSMRSQLALGSRVLIAVACLAAVPQPFVVPSAYAVAGPPFTGRVVVMRRVTDTVGFIRALELPAPVQVLTTTDGFGALLGSGFHEVKLWLKGAQPLDGYMRAHDVGVVVNLEGGRNSFGVDDPMWQHFQGSPESAGFTRLSVPNHEVVGVYVRDDLIEDAHRSAAR